MPGWEPLSEHPAVLLSLAISVKQYELKDDELYAGLGSDDAEPTHVLILDRTENQMAIAQWKETHQFLKAQHPPVPVLSSQEIEALFQTIAEVMEQASTTTLQELSRQGMLEQFLSPDPNIVQQRESMLQFLNKNLDPEIQQWLARHKYSGQN